MRITYDGTDDEHDIYERMLTGPLRISIGDYYEIIILKSNK